MYWSINEFLKCSLGPGCGALRNDPYQAAVVEMLLLVDADAKWRMPPVAIITFVLQLSIAGWSTDAARWIQAVALTDILPPQMALKML
ncbi:hypothetical protein Nepgr_006674 [Nepenthes gracilis]|uniref:Uncharacterized protein n=1 Tax=Nepenthes gracilis TaxID=150966 RepID=A0AAD3S5H7_NEPGR|nr:hypothetical protein Nepgr_006674 [Nepenthes gracilis]